MSQEAGKEADTLGFALDHLVVAASTLDAGVAWIAAKLGVAPAGGGAHSGMATHNRLLGLGDCYLEVIARDPSATPARPRWFGLDNSAWAPDAATAPRLISLALRVNDLDAALAEFDPAAVATAASRGNLHWRIGLRPNGTMPFSGAFPTFIEWPDGVGPARGLPDSGCRLRSLAIQHPQASAFEAGLRRGLADKRVRFATGPLSLRATIATPQGLATID